MAVITEKPFLELAHLGEHLAAVRSIRKLSQTELAEMSSIPQATISQFENGKRIPSLEHLVRLARALNVSLQWFLRGSNYPGVKWQDIAIQLRELGIIDLFVEGTTVPGAFLPNEQLVALVLSLAAPEPRIVEAIPAVLAWNQWDSPELLKAYGEHYGTRTLRRLAWLADVTLTVLRTGGFPVGCVSSRQLEEFRDMVSLPPNDQDHDTLGRTTEIDPLPPVSKRWRIGYPADLSVFVNRASELLAKWRNLRRQQSLTRDDLA